MRILKLEAANIKRLSVVQIEPDGSVVEIAGDNGAGKTSVLDAIWWALAGARAIQSKPVRRGAKSAHVMLDLGDASGVKLKVTRRFSEEGEPTLRVEDATGGRLKEPQSVLNAIIGALALDPVAFQRMTPAERVDVLKRLVPDFDFDDAAALRQKIYDQRTARGRDAKALRAQYEGIEPAPPGTPDEEIDTDELVRAISAATDTATEYERLKWRRENLEREIDDAIKAAVELEERAVKLRLDADEARAILDKMPEPERPADISEARKALGEANVVNANVRAKIARADIGKGAAAAEADVAKLTKDIEALDERVRTAVEQADLPVRGLALGEADVLLAGVPFDQASDAEQLRASMAIAMAENPELRVIRVRDGSLLDAKGFEVIRKVAEADDYQIWIESVSPHGPAAIIMVDGRVKP